MNLLHSKFSIEDVESPSIPEIVKLLIKAYCDEMTATLQYMMAKHLARGEGYCDVIPEYEQHEEDEHKHAEAILKRLEQIGVSVPLDYTEIQNGGNEWVPIKTQNIHEQLQILIKAEEDARDFYGTIVECARTCKDWISEKMAKAFMEDEQEHATDLRRIYEGLK